MLEGDSDQLGRRDNPDVATGEKAGRVGASHASPINDIVKFELEARWRAHTLVEI